MAVDVAACRCAGSRGHFGYLGRKQARSMAHAHTRSVNDGIVACAKCDSGFAPQVFRCAHRDHIWHWGHGQRGATPTAPDEAARP